MAGSRGSACLTLSEAVTYNLPTIVFRLLMSGGVTYRQAFVRFGEEIPIKRDILLEFGPRLFIWDAGKKVFTGSHLVRWNYSVLSMATQSQHEEIMVALATSALRMQLTHKIREIERQPAEVKNIARLSRTRDRLEAAQHMSSSLGGEIRLEYWRRLSLLFGAFFNEWAPTPDGRRRLQELRELAAMEPFQSRHDTQGVPG